MQYKILKNVSILNIIATLFAIASPFFLVQDAQAAGLAQGYVRLDRLKTATPTTGIVCARPGTATSTSVGISVTFPTVAVTNYTVSSTTSKWAATGTGIPAGTTAWPGIGSATIGVSGQKVTWTTSVQTLALGTTYCFTWADTTALTTSAAGTNQIGLIELSNSGPVVIDSGQYALSIVADDSVVVTGTVNPTFSFALSATSTSLGTIANSVVSATPTPTVTVITNAKNGYTTWVKDSNNGTLNSASASSNIPVPGAVGGASYDLTTMTATGAFGLGVTVSGGSLAADAAYNGAVAGRAGRLSSSYAVMAASTAPASSDVVTLIPRAIASTTQAPANDYTDTITVVAAGQF